MVHEHWLYYMDGHDPTQPSVYILVSPLYDTMHSIWLGGLDKGQYRYGGQLCTDNHNRYHSVYKDDSIMALPRGMNKYWSSIDSQEFELLSVYTPFEEQDEWARYRDILNDKLYNCRLEAFLARFRAIPD